MTDERKSSAIRCATCGEAINMTHNNYRVVGIRVHPDWLTPGTHPDPPQSIFKHKFCMDADEWACVPVEDNA